MKKKLLRVVFEYEDTIESIDNADKAQEWINHINSMCIFMQNRGGPNGSMNPFEKFDAGWKIVDRTKTESV